MRYTLSVFIIICLFHYSMCCNFFTFIDYSVIPLYSIIHSFIDCNKFFFALLICFQTGQSPSVILNPYHLVLTPTLESQHLKTLSLPRQNSLQIQQNNPLKVTTSKTVKRHSKSFINTVVDEIPVVNPAFNDGTIMPTAISDYDDPLRLHHLPQQNPHPDLVEIRTNQKHSPSTTTTTTRPLNVANDNDNNQLLSQTIITNNRSIPSFHLTKNVHSTLSKLSDPIEFCHLSSTTTTTTSSSAETKSNMNITSNEPQQQQQSIGMSSFQRRQQQQQQNPNSNHPLPPTIQTMQTIQMNPRFSTSSSISNQSSDISGDPSTTSSLFYVDYRPSSSSMINTNEQQQQQQQHRNSSVSELSSNSSTITDGSSGGDNHEIDDDLPPPPDILLCDDDIDSGGDQQQQQQLTPTNKIAELLPPLPPDYHSISTLQKRKYQQPPITTQQFTITNTLNRSKPSANINSVGGYTSSTINDVPAYSTTTLSSFSTLPQKQQQLSSSKNYYGRKFYDQSMIQPPSMTTIQINQRQNFQPINIVNHHQQPLSVINSPTNECTEVIIATETPVQHPPSLINSDCCDQQPMKQDDFLVSKDYDDCQTEITPDCSDVTSNVTYYPSTFNNDDDLPNHDNGKSIMANNQNSNKTMMMINKDKLANIPINNDDDKDEQDDENDDQQIENRSKSSQSMLTKSICCCFPHWKRYLVITLFIWISLRYFIHLGNI